MDGMDMDMDIPPLSTFTPSAASNNKQNTDNSDEEQLHRIHEKLNDIDEINQYINNIRYENILANHQLSIVSEYICLLQLITRQNIHTMSNAALFQHTHEVHAMTSLNQHVACIVNIHIHLNNNTGRTIRLPSNVCSAVISMRLNRRNENMKHADIECVNMVQSNDTVQLALSLREWQPNKSKLSLDVPLSASMISQMLLDSTCDIEAHIFIQYHIHIDPHASHSSGAVAGKTDLIYGNGSGNDDESSTLKLSKALYLPVSIIRISNNEFVKSLPSQSASASTTNQRIGSNEWYQALIDSNR